MYETKRAKRLSHARVHFVTGRASLFTDHRMSGPPIRAKYSRQFESIVLTLLPPFPILSFCSDGIQLLSCFFRQFAKLLVEPV